MGGTVSVYAMPYPAVGFGGRSLLRRRRPTGGAVTQSVPPVVNASAADIPGGPGRPATDRICGTGTFRDTAQEESARAQSTGAGADDRAGQTAVAVPAAAAPIVGAAWTPPTWDEVVEQHSARVYRLAYRLTGNQYDAEDLTQEVFVRVFRSLSTYTPGTFEGWLHRITTNLFLDQARRKQRIRFDALVRRRGRPAPQPCGPARTRPSTTPTSTTTSRRRSPRCHRTSGPPSCCATSRGCLRGDRRDARPQARHGPLPDPPRPGPAAGGVVASASDFNLDFDPADAGSGWLQFQFQFQFQLQLQLQLQHGGVGRGPSRGSGGSPGRRPASRRYCRTRPRPSGRVSSPCREAAEAERLMKARLASLRGPEPGTDLMQRLLAMGGPNGPLPPPGPVMFREPRGRRRSL